MLPGIDRLSHVQYRLFQAVRMSRIVEHVVENGQVDSVYE